MVASVFIYARISAISDNQLTPDYLSMLDFELWRSNLYLSCYGRESVISFMPAMTPAGSSQPRAKSSLLKKLAERSAGNTPRSRLPPFPPNRLRAVPTFTTVDAFQGSLLQGFRAEISPDDSLLSHSRIVSIEPVSPSASPPLRSVTTRAPRSQDLWEAARTVAMPTAGPLYLEDIPALHQTGAPVTGIKRQRSLSESDSDLAQALQSVAPLSSIATPLSHRPCQPPPAHPSRRPRKKSK